MKAKLFVVLSLLALASLLVGAVSAQGRQRPLAAAPSAAGAPSAAAQARVADVLHSSPVMFIQNDGQFGEGARFQTNEWTRSSWNR